MKVSSVVKFIKIIEVLVLTNILFLASCVPNSSLSTKRGVASSKSTNANGGTNSTPNNGNGAVADGTNTDSTTINSKKVELSHLVDPFTGNYKKKITIPKNYKGYLYIAGLNLSVLSSKIVYVRLNFGQDKQSIVFQASLNKSSGIIPSTDIQVLMLDLNKRQLQDMKLPYDLYDYNDYAADTSLAPVNDPYDGNLYCRGLKITDDPTMTSSDYSCKSSSDKCLYSYAKVVDSGLYQSTLAMTPNKPNILDVGQTFNFNYIVSGACLPDKAETYTSQFKSLIDAQSTYTYNGPYRAINYDSWQITSSAIVGANGLFEDVTGGLWYQSKLFPRAGTTPISSGINYLGSSSTGASSRFGARQWNQSNSTGTTAYMDGCSLRVLNYDSATNVGIGSCNVIASIEVFYKNGSTEIPVTSTNELKIQLVRDSNKNSLGQEVLGQNFKNCTTSAACGSEECCYNNRCWSKDLVSQCVDSTSATGNYKNGDSCTYDYECASLCCNASLGRCSAHNPSATTPIFCSKSAGEQCISTEFCKKESVPVCKLYKTGTNANGTVTCQIRCNPVETFGSCVGGTCIAPKGQTDTSGFDTTTCAGAIDP